MTDTNDLISRQSAIDEINKLEYPSSLVDVKWIIVNLPSAQPEIIYCKDCEYWSEYEHINGKPELFPFCGLHMTFFREDDFCSHAERREE